MHVYELENVSVQYSGRSQPRRWCIKGTIVVTDIPIKANVITYLEVYHQNHVKAFTLANRSTKILAELLGVKGSSLIDLMSRPTRRHPNILAAGFTER